MVLGRCCHTITHTSTAEEEQGTILVTLWSICLNLCVFSQHLLLITFFKIGKKSVTLPVTSSRKIFSKGTLSPAELLVDPGQVWKLSCCTRNSDPDCMWVLVEHILPLSKAGVASSQTVGDPRSFATWTWYASTATSKERKKIILIALKVLCKHKIHSWNNTYNRMSLSCPLTSLLTLSLLWKQGEN